VPSGPTVTASGRHVRSRATGAYGETLHSGQVSDHASPATGDYAQSDASEEPRAQGRSTRAGNRGTTNGRAANRTIVSDDEEDATSWDGGDEDEEEPEQMDLDDDEDDQGEESEEEEEESPTLMVTLRYGKGSSTGPTTGNEVVPDATPANGVDQNGVHSAGTLQPSEQIPAPIEPTPHPEPPSHPIPAFPPTQASAVSNGIIAQPPQPPVVPAAQHPLPVGDPAILPKLDGMMAGPPPPNGAPQEQLAPQLNGLPTQQQSFVPPLPSPAPATTWQ
jgi:hypothetical protein